MPNGRNAGRLFADCENKHGYGASHAIADLDDEPIDRPLIEGEVLMCHHCHRRLLWSDGELTVIEVGNDAIPDPGWVLSLEAAARRLDVSVEALKQLIAEGELRVTTYADGPVVHEDSLNEYLLSRGG